MRKAYVTSALAGAFLLGMATAALAVTGEFDNMCTQGPGQGRKDRLLRKTYCFGNQAAKAEFMKDPKGNARACANRLGLLPVRFRMLVPVLTETPLRSLPTALARR